MGGGLIKNTLVLTISNMLMRLIGLLFQIYISKKIGAEGIGIYFLIISVNLTAATFAISGGRFAATRLVSEEIGKGNYAGAFKAIKICIIYSAVFGIAATFMLLIFAQPIGLKIIGDSRTVLSLKYLSIGLPFLSTSAVISGFFTAIKKAYKGAICDFCEQFFRIIATLILISLIKNYSAEMSCVVLVLGSVVGEIAAFLLSVTLLLFERRKYTFNTSQENMLFRLFSIAMPLAISAYVRTGLSTLQNILIPKGLKRGGATSKIALESYGEVQGMVFPIVTFPAAIFVSLAEMLVPELTMAQVRNRNEYITKFTTRLIKFCMLFSVGVMGYFINFCDQLALFTYGVQHISRYIKYLSFLMPIMYLDTVTDGMLRGLGEQNYSMRVNIIDSAISLLLVYMLTPKYGVYGYIFVLYFSEIFNISLSLYKLYAVTGLKFCFNSFALSILSMFGSANVSQVLIRILNITEQSLPVFILESVIYFTCYAGMIIAFRCLSDEDILSISKRLKNIKRQRSRVVFHKSL